MSITTQGELVKSYAEQVFNLYNQLEFDLNLVKNQTMGQLRLGASTTISQYIIPPVLARFHRRFPDIRVGLVNGNSTDIEALLALHKIDIGIVEGISNNTGLKYIPFLKDEIVLVCRVQNQKAGAGIIHPKQIPQLPLLTREDGSGTLDIVNDYFRKHALSAKDLQVEIQLGSTEAIKNYLLHSDCFAFLSVFSVRQELLHHQLKIIDIRGFDIHRTLQYCYLQGQPIALAELFMKFASANH